MNEDTETSTNNDGVSPPMFFAASLNRPEKCCWRTSKLIFFFILLLFCLTCLLDPLISYKIKVPLTHNIKACTNYCRSLLIYNLNEE